MSKITRISAALALMVAVVSGCKSNNNVADGGCGCAGSGGVVSPGMAGTPVSGHPAPISGMTSPVTGTMGSPMPTGSSAFTPSSTQGMTGGQYGGR